MMADNKSIAPLVTTEWLANELGTPDLRIVDATVHLRPKDDGTMEVVSGREGYDAGHIPGAAFADLVEDLSDPSTPLRFMLPPEERFATAMGRLGVGDGSRVVVYSGGHVMWATRLWWMLRAFGFENAAVLDGGLGKWKLEGRPLSDAAVTPEPARFTATIQPELIAGKDDVLAAVEGGMGGVCIMDALPGELYDGSSPVNYGRAGHIKSAVSVPYGELTDAETGAFLPLADLREKLAPALAEEVSGVITYCGGGIAATEDAFALTLLGKENVAVYDASLQEWARDESLPMARE